MPLSIYGILAASNNCNLRVWVIEDVLCTSVTYIVITSFTELSKVTQGSGLLRVPSV